MGDKNTKRQKLTVHRGDPSTNKEIHIQDDQVDDWKLTPIWSFCIFDQDLQMPNGDLKTCCFHEIATLLKGHEGRPWAQIVGNNHRDHFTEVDVLARFAVDRLRAIGMYHPNEIPELFRFRFSGRRRLWGIKEGRIFKVLWWDPEHEVYPVKAK